jgi:alcohol dehydrogenase class IV
VRFAYDALPGRFVFGCGAVRALPDELARLGVSRVLLCATDREAEQAAEHLTPAADRIAGTFRGVRPHVPIEVAQAARDRAAECGADALLAIGGGSTTGTAKAVALTTGLPILAVPTTYAGSEVTPVWGLTEGNRKTTGRDPKVLPRVVIYDPELTVSLPAGLSGVSGLNGVAHCVEAFWAAGTNPISALQAEEGLRTLAAGLPQVVADGADLEARSAALYGAYLAGAAFAVTGSGLHHRICHALAGAYDLPHAETHAVVLPHVLALYAPAVPEVEGRIAAALGTSPGGAVPGLVALAHAVGAPDSLAAVGLPKAALDDAVALVTGTVATDGPRPVTSEALATLVRAAWQGPPRH